MRPGVARTTRGSIRRLRLTIVATATLLVTGCTNAATPPAPDPEPTPARSTEPSPSFGRPLVELPPRSYATAPPGKPGRDRYLHQDLVWQGCGAGLECAKIAVPLDYRDDEGPAITLDVARRPHTGTTSRGLLLINPGGPGGSATDMARWFKPEPLLGYDIIGLDVRGTGRSNPVSCFGPADLDRLNAVDTSPDTPQERQDLVDEARTFGASCAQQTGPLLAHVSTAEAVRDLDLLRAVLGAKKINFLGYSYGSYLGALYAQRYPHRVDKMVLDGAEDISPHPTVPQIAGFETAYRHFASWCAQQDCALGPDADAVARRGAQLLTDLDQAPVRVGDRTLSQQQGVAGVFGLLYGGEQTWPRLRLDLERLAAEDGAPLLADADEANFRRGDGSYSPFVYAFPAIRCSDDPAASIADQQAAFQQQARQAPLLNSLAGPDYGCAAWPVAPAPRPTITAAGAPPILVLGSTGDPATPYAWAEGMAHQLESGVLVTRVGEGHTAFGRNPCIDAIVYRYFLSSSPPVRNQSC